jgi:hypothetical protein
MFLLSAGGVLVTEGSGGGTTAGASGQGQLTIGKAEFREYFTARLSGQQPEPDDASPSQASGSRASRRGRSDSSVRRADALGDMNKWMLDASRTVVDVSGVVDQNDDLL